MPVEVTSKVSEGGPAFITGIFKDEADAYVIPATLKWTLTDDEGDVVNSRTAVAVAVPATSNTVVISGADTTVSSGRRRRYFLFEGTYVSTEGTLPLTGEVTFLIDDFKGMS